MIVLVMPFIVGSMGELYTSGNCSRAYFPFSDGLACASNQTLLFLAQAQG